MYSIVLSLGAGQSWPAFAKTAKGRPLKMIPEGMRHPPGGDSAAEGNVELKSQKFKGES
jgi:hypothetical protein